MRDIIYEYRGTLIAPPKNQGIFWEFVRAQVLHRVICVVCSNMRRNCSRHCCVRCQVVSCGLCSRIYTSVKKIEI